MTFVVDGSLGAGFPDGSYQPSSASPYVLKNRLLNGAFQIAQRGTSFTLTSGATQYTLDRWYANTTGGAGVVAQTGSVGNYALQMTGASGVSSAFFGQKIESNNIADLASQTVTYSITLSSSTLTSITWYARFPTAQDNYAGVTNISNGTLTLTSTPTVYTFQISLPSGAANGLEIFFLTGAFTSGTLTVKNAQLEIGTSATPFERRLYNQELNNCQRYYFNDFTYCQGSFYSTTGIVGTNRLPVTMRASPSVSLTSGTTIATDIVGGSSSTMTPSFSYITPNSLRYSGTNGSSASIGSPVNITSSTIQASAEL